MARAVNVVLLVPYPQAEVLRAVVRRTDSGVLGLPVLKDQLQGDRAVVVVGTEPVGCGNGLRQRIGMAEQHGVD